jgi:hypothetical protein
MSAWNEQCGRLQDYEQCADLCKRKGKIPNLNLAQKENEALSLYFVDNKKRHHNATLGRGGALGHLEMIHRAVLPI